MSYQPGRKLLLSAKLGHLDRDHELLSALFGAAREHILIISL